MNRFVQLHVLTSYPPSNLNRDDTGRPKTAVYGGALRLRVSSQSLKRAWRTSEVFEDALAGHRGDRTRRLGREILERLLQANIGRNDALVWTRAIAGQFGKLEFDKIEEKKTATRKAGKKTKAGVQVLVEVQPEDAEGTAAEGGSGREVERAVDLAQLAHISPEERQAVAALVDKLVQRRSAPNADELRLLGKARTAVDIAMFGRMLAESPEHSVDASIQVAHAITVHRAEVEGDYFTAVDDLQPCSESGAAHLDERGYGAGLFYLYVCINRHALRENLGGDAGLTERAVRSLVQAITTVSPGGMQNSFASRAFASHVLAERGDEQPRSLAQSFLLPVRPRDDESLLQLAIKRLTITRENFERAYGAGSASAFVLDVESGQGTLAALADFAAG